MSPPTLLWWFKEATHTHTHPGEVVGSLYPQHILINIKCLLRVEVLPVMVLVIDSCLLWKRVITSLFLWLGEGLELRGGGESEYGTSWLAFPFLVSDLKGIREDQMMMVADIEYPTTVLDRVSHFRFWQ